MANLEAIDEVGDSSLMIASQNGHQDIVSLLLTHGANIEAKGNGGFTSLMIASRNGHKEVVLVLLTL